MDIKKETRDVRWPIYLEGRIWTYLTGERIQDILHIYHYEEKDLSLLKRVSSDIISCMRGQEAIYLRPQRETGNKWDGAVVVMTLGTAVDVLQERYQKAGRLLESYMVENICGELLMQGYHMLENWVQEHMGVCVKAYHFPGGENGYPLQMIPELLQGQNKVTCNEGYCLLPKKSVVFIAELTEDICQSPDICAGCSRRADGTCQRKMFSFS